MVFLQPLGFKFGPGPPVLVRGKTLIAVTESRCGGKFSQGPFPIFNPIGNHIKITGRAEPPGQKLRKGPLNQPPFMVPFFRPGIGEKNMYPREGSGRNHFRENFDRVVFYDADVRDLPFFYFPEEPSDTGPEHLDPYIIFSGVFLGDYRGGEAHTKTDFHGYGAFITEKRPQVQKALRKGNRVTGSRALIGSPLGITHPSSPEDIAFYPAFFRERGFG
jgi:hypothetical protein